MKNRDINPSNWENMAADRNSWKDAVKTGAHVGNQKKVQQWEERRERRRQGLELDCIATAGDAAKHQSVFKGTKLHCLPRQTDAMNE